MTRESEESPAALPPTPLEIPHPEGAQLQLEWRRLHPLSPLLRGGLFLLVLIGIVIANLRDRLLELFFAKEYIDAMGPNEGDLIEFLVERSLLVWVLLAVLAVILLIIGFSWLVWRFASFRITTEAVEARSGVIFKQHRQAPLERIQSVNLHRSLLARVFGLTQVEVQTAGQGGKVSLQYLGHRDAKQVREQILLAASASRGQAKAGFALDERLHDIADADIDPSAIAAGSLVKVPFGRLIASILLGSEMLILVFLTAAIVVSSILASPFALAALFPVVLIMVGVMLGQFNKGFNFVLSRASDGVRIGAGLTSTTTETIPFGRVHAVEALQPLGWRPFGWWKIRITTAGHSAADAGQNKMQNTVLPVGQVDDVLRVFDTLLHEESGGVDQPDALLRDALIGEGQGFLKAGARSGAVLLFARKRAGLRIEHATEAHASLRVRRGWFTRTLSVMPILRAQSIQLRRPLVHRMLGLATLQAHTVLGPVQMQMRGIALHDARQAFEVLGATVVRVQGAEAQQVAARVQEQQ